MTLTFFALLSGKSERERERETCKLAFRSYRERYIGNSAGEDAAGDEVAKSVSLSGISRAHRVGMTSDAKGIWS